MKDSRNAKKLYKKIQSGENVSDEEYAKLALNKKSLEAFNRLIEVYDEDRINYFNGDENAVCALIFSVYKHKLEKSSELIRNIDNPSEYTFEVFNAYNEVANSILGAIATSENYKKIHQKLKRR